MRACPYPCAGYTPAAMPEQEVHLLGAEWWRGSVCPGSVVVQDGVAEDVLGDFQALEKWCHGQTLDWWHTQPAWWVSGIREAQRMKDAIEAEAAEAT